MPSLLTPFELLLAFPTLGIQWLMCLWNSSQNWEGRTADISEPSGGGRTEKTNRTSLKTSRGTQDSLAVSGCLCRSPSRDAGSELPQASVVSSLILIDLIVSSSQTMLVLMRCLRSALSASSGCPEEGTLCPFGI